MNSHPEFNHNALFPALEALSYVREVAVSETESGTECIAVEITDDGHGAIFKDLPELARQHKVVRTKPVSTCVALDKEANRATLTPA